MFERYVALGDSSTEGLDDPDGDGGYRGWADRLAEQVAVAYPGLAYANLAVRGRSAGEIAATQLAPALAMHPDLATVVAGMNDLLRRSFDAARVAGHVGDMVRALVGVGATVMTFTIPDAAPRMRLGRAFSARTHALNVELRRIASETGAVLLDLASYELATDPRMWAVDRLHGNPEGHARIAAQLAFLLELPGSSDGSLGEIARSGFAGPRSNAERCEGAIEPAQPRRRRDVVLDDLAWIARFVAPWAWRRLRGRTTGDGMTAKRPTLLPVVPRG